MTTKQAVHATFTLEKAYLASPERVFQAWADPTAKARWFGAAEHSLDFKVGGIETNCATTADNVRLAVESRYHDIVPNERIIYSTALSTDDQLSTVSVTTVEFAADGEGTKLVLTEYGTFIDGHEEPSWRVQGTSDWLDALGNEFKN
jgi:uncharacterized protein YndB with AHSA1/START domain